MTTVGVKGLRNLEHYWTTGRMVEYWTAVTMTLVQISPTATVYQLYYRLNQYTGVRHCSNVKLFLKIGLTQLAQLDRHLDKPCDANGRVKVNGRNTVCNLISTSFNTENNWHICVSVSTAC